MEKNDPAATNLPSVRKRTGRLPMLVLLAGFLVLALNGWMRVMDSITDWYWYSTYHVQPGPLYLVVSGAIWGLAGLLAIAWIGLRRNNYRLVGAGAGLVFLTSYWIDRLLIEQPGGPGSNTLFAAGVSLASSLYLWAVLRPDLAWKELRRK